MTDITQQHIAVLVKRLRTTVMPRRTSPQDKAIIDNLMDAADMLEQLAEERDALKARAEKAEAELERVKEMRDQIVGDKINLRGELATMRVEVKRLRAALFECQEEIDAYIRFEYPHDHPVQERYRQRDYAANPARIALQEKPHD